MRFQKRSSSSLFPNLSGHDERGGWATSPISPFAHHYCIVQNSETREGINSIEIFDMSCTETTETKDEAWKGAGSNQEYGESEYWDDRFAQEPSYEWLLTFKEVAMQMSPFLKSSDKILVVGCGNSNFSADLYDAGFTNVVNIDFSSVVIENMREKNQDRPDMEWQVRFLLKRNLDVPPFQCHLTLQNCFSRL
jgi:hypothetical protein